MLIVPVALSSLGAPGGLTFCSEGAEKTAGQREATMGPEDLRELCWGLVLCHETERWLSAACVQAHTSSLTPKT